MIAETLLTHCRLLIAGAWRDLAIEEALAMPRKYSREVVL